jgi:sialate O-acetylesterase
MRLVSVIVPLLLCISIPSHALMTPSEDHDGAVPPKDMDVWVVAGQSNSQGWALLKAPVPSDPQVFFWDPSGHWVEAREPLNKDFSRWTPEPLEPNILLQRSGLSSQDEASVEEFLRRWRAQSSVAPGGVGPGVIFANRLHQATHRAVGLILCGVGSPIGEWDPDSTPRGKLYDHMLDLIRASGGRVKGLIWYQGESDALTPGAAARYRTALLQLIDGVRRDLNQPELPILCVQIGRFAYPYDRGAEDWEAVREAQRQAALERPHVYLVSSIDLLLEDDIHVGFEGYQRLAPRLAEIALSQVYKIPGHGSSLALESAQLIATDSRRPMIRVKVSGVSGRLKAEGRPSGFEVRTPLPAQDPGEKYPQQPADVPLYSVYRVDFDPSDPTALILGLFDASPILLGHYHPVCEPLELIYAPGLNPYANITDAKDIALPAFGPVEVKAPSCQNR